MAASEGAGRNVVDLKMEKIKNDERISLSAFFRIAQDWQLSTDDQIVLLGKPPRSTFYKWKKDGGNISQDTLERISYILGIYKALQILFPSSKASSEWLRQENAAPILNSQSALDRMLGGSVSDLYLLRRYLDAQRGG